MYPSKIPGSKCIRNPISSSERVYLDVNYDDLENAVVGNQKIAAIKIIRTVTNLGLKESKELVESFSNNKEGAKKLWRELLKIVKLPEERDLTNEEVLVLVKDALENSSNFFFPTKLDILKCLIENIEKHGGSKKIAEEIDSVIDSL
jgi:predicted amino acid dehydrogenase